MGCDCFTLSNLVYAVGLFVIAKTLIPIILGIIRGNKKPELIEKNWKKDVVYFYQFKGGPTLSSASPFCIKVEAYLRLNNIKFERIDSTSARGANGKLPMIELNGEQIADSQIILKKLAQKFSIKDYENEEKAAVGHAVSRMADNHTFGLLLFFKARDLSPMLNLFLRGTPVEALSFLLVPVFSRIGGCVLRGRAASSVGKFKDEEYAELLKNDLKQIQTLLGKNNYLLGADPSPADCTVFGQLASNVYLWPDAHGFIPSYLINSPEFVALKEWMARFRDRAFGSNFHQ